MKVGAVKTKSMGEGERRGEWWGERGGVGEEGGEKGWNRRCMK